MIIDAINKINFYYTRFAKPGCKINKIKWNKFWANDNDYEYIENVCCEWLFGVGITTTNYVFNTISLIVRFVVLVAAYYDLFILFRW